MAQSKISIESRSGQFILVLLAALMDLSDRTPSKREVENQIEKLDISSFRRKLKSRAYDSKAEPQWKTLLAYAQRNAVDRGP